MRCTKLAAGQLASLAVWTLFACFLYLKRGAPPGGPVFPLAFLSKL